MKSMVRKTGMSRAGFVTDLECIQTPGVEVCAILAFDGRTAIIELLPSPEVECQYKPCLYDLSLFGTTWPVCCSPSERKAAGYSPIPGNLINIFCGY
jgi:hypothetical protein